MWRRADGKRALKRPRPLDDDLDDPGLPRRDTKAGNRAAGNAPRRGSHLTDKRQKTKHANSIEALVRTGPSVCC